MPHLDSNIPKQIFYSALVGEFLRIARSTLLLNDFVPEAQALVARMFDQGAEGGDTIRHLRKIISKHREDFLHFGKSDDEFIAHILDQLPCFL